MSLNVKPSARPAMSAEKKAKAMEFAAGATTAAPQVPAQTVVPATAQSFDVSSVLASGRVGQKRAVSLDDETVQLNVRVRRKTTTTARRVLREIQDTSPRATIADIVEDALTMWLAAWRSSAHPSVLARIDRAQDDGVTYE